MSRVVEFLNGKIVSRGDELSGQTIDGVILNTEFPDDFSDKIIRELTNDNLSLVVTDPPYGDIVNKYWDKEHSQASDMAEQMLKWTKYLEKICVDGSALYVWGGYGKPKFRPFYKYIVRVEEETPWQLSMHITWKKKRAYGVQHNYLSTREECAYFVLGDIKKPKLFNVPLLDKERGYAGYNKKYPALSKYLRRTCVWDDITEILKNKIHECQKPEKIYSIPIEVHTNEGDWVLDPFAGAGTCGVAAINLNRKFILIERDKEEFNKCIKRFEENLYNILPGTAKGVKHDSPRVKARSKVKKVRKEMLNGQKNTTLGGQVKKTRKERPEIRGRK